MICPRCGEDNLPGTQFCIECGYNLQQQIRCPHCGQAVIQGSKFCENCGKPMNVQPAQPVPAEKASTVPATQAGKTAAAQAGKAKSAAAKKSKKKSGKSKLVPIIVIVVVVVLALAAVYFILNRSKKDSGKTPVYEAPTVASAAAAAEASIAPTAETTALPSAEVCTTPAVTEPSTTPSTEPEAAPMTAQELLDAELAALKSAQAGDIVIFGTYEQDNDTSNGAEDIEWYVLETTGDQVMLVSKYALDAQPYNTKAASVTWEKCSLRTWLNDSFYNTAFTAEEQAQLMEVTVPAEDNAVYGTKAGNDTQDKVFLLSSDDASAYFSKQEDSRCSATAYALAQGAYQTNEYTTTDGDGTCWWWLRSPGYTDTYAADILMLGYVSDDGGTAVNETGAVRPAICLSLDPS